MAKTEKEKTDRVLRAAKEAGARLAGTTKIHGKTVKIGTGVGERTGRKVKAGISERQRRMAEELDFLDSGATSGRASKHEKDMYGK